MNTQINFRKLSVVFSLAALAGITTLAVSCGHPGSSGQSTCTGSAGTELCPCEAGNVCQSGLVCATDKNECVSLTGGGGGTTGGAGTTGGGNSTGSAGTTGAAGRGTPGIAGTTGPAGGAG